MHIQTFLKPLSFLPAIFMMYIIFVFSGQEGELSSSISYKASVVIVKTADYVLDAGLEDWQIENYAVRINGITRKLAHMTEYFLLAVAVSFPLYVYGLHGIWLVLIAGIICVGYAASDEYHQSYVAGRAASLKDVGIDSIGVLLGIILVRIIGWTGRHTIFRPYKDEDESNLSKRQLKKLEKRQKKLEQEMQRQREEDEAQERREKAGERRKKKLRSRDEYEDEYEEDPQDDPYWEDEPSGDDLSEDMPLSSFLRKR